MKNKNNNRNKKGANKMAAAVKPICPTIVRNKKIILDIVSEVMRKPNQKAIENNKKALDLLNKLRD